MGAGFLRFIWLSQVHIFLCTFLPFTPFSPIVLQPSNFKSSQVSHLALFFLVEFYCFITVYFSFIYQYTLFVPLLLWDFAEGVMAFQPPGKRFYELGDHTSSFVLGSACVACHSSVQSKYSFENVPDGG